MSKEDSIEVTGTVVEKFPSGLFSVQLDQERTVLAHLAGKLRRNRIRVLAGDRVTLEMSRGLDDHSVGWGAHDDQFDRCRAADRFHTRAWVA